MPADDKKDGTPGGRFWAIALIAVAAAFSCTARGIPHKESSAWFECTRLFGKMQASCLAKLSVEICDKTANAQDQVKCVKGIASAKVDAKQCEQIKVPKDRDECVSFVAAENKDVSICDGIQNPYRRDACREQHGDYFRGTACAHIEDTTRRDACYLQSVARFHGSVDLCDEVVERKPECLIRFAQERPEICEQIGSGPSSLPRRRCYDDAFEHRDSCTGVSDRLQRLECEARLAKRAKSSVTCAAITNSEDADDCWDAVAKTDGALCLEIKQPEFRQQCLKKYWPKAKDARICSSLTPAYLAQACSARFGLMLTSRPGR
jgi:hypothetical protein